MNLFILIMAIVLQPIAEAVDRLSTATPIGATLKSAEWEQVPREIREAAIFSARVENARVLDKIKSGLREILANQRDEFGVIADRAKFIADLRDLAEREGLTPQDPALKGGIQDITSRKRAELILKTQTEMAYNAARHKRGTSPSFLRAAPAQELVRIEERREKRRWVDTWRAFGGRTFPGKPSIGGELQPGASGIRCIALKADPIWSNISRFGNPYPPFDFGSGVGVASLTRSEAYDLGLIGLNEEPAPAPEVKLTDNLEVDVSQMDVGVRDELIRGMGDLAELVGGILRWKKGAAA